MNKPKLVIFDLDGTLVDAYKAITTSFNYTMKELGLSPQDYNIIKMAVGWGDENLLRPFVPSKLLKKALFIYRNNHKWALLTYAKLYPYVISTLDYLKKKGYMLAVASNRPTKFSLILVKHLNIGRFFSYILCKDAVKYGKPHPLILKKIMSKLSFDSKDTLYIGDMDIDAQAGRRAGVNTIIVTGGSSKRSQIEKEKPGRIISHIKELKRIL